MIRLPKSLLRRAEKLAEQAAKSEVVGLLGTKPRRPDILRWAIRIGLDELERNNLSALQLTREPE